jgi:hypothetical protein
MGHTVQEPCRPAIVPASNHRTRPGRSHGMNNQSQNIRNIQIRPVFFITRLYPLDDRCSDLGWDKMRLYKILSVVAIALAIAVVAVPAGAQFCASPFGMGGCGFGCPVACSPFGTGIGYNFQSCVAVESSFCTTGGFGFGFPCGFGCGFPCGIGCGVPVSCGYGCGLGSCGVPFGCGLGACGVPGLGPGSCGFSTPFC